MSALANIFEAAGLATVGISLVRGQAESSKPPRMLNVDFPLGRPLGKPGDAAFQQRVLDAAFELLSRTDAPILVDYPEAIEDQVGEPAACPLPPRTNADMAAELDEVHGLRDAYDRNVAATGRTSVGRAGGPDDVASMVEKFMQIEAGASLSDVGWDEWSAMAASQDVRSYYVEAAMQLAEVTGARQVESWLYKTTATGRMLKRTMGVVAESGESNMLATYLLPMSQHG